MLPVVSRLLSGHVHHELVQVTVLLCVPTQASVHSVVHAAMNAAVRQTLRTGRSWPALVVWLEQHCGHVDDLYMLNVTAVSLSAPSIKWAAHLIMLVAWMITIATEHQAQNLRSVLRIMRDTCDRPYAGSTWRRPVQLDRNLHLRPREWWLCFAQNIKKRLSLVGRTNWDPACNLMDDMDPCHQCSSFCDTSCPLCETRLCSTCIASNIVIDPQGKMCGTWGHLNGLPELF